jgi:hypothetical protein
MKNFDSLRDLDAHIEQHYRGIACWLLYIIIIIILDAVEESICRYMPYIF